MNYYSMPQADGMIASRERAADSGILIPPSPQSFKRMYELHDRLVSYCMKLNTPDCISSNKEIGPT